MTVMNGLTEKLDDRKDKTQIPPKCSENKDIFQPQWVFMVLKKNLKEEREKKKKNYFPELDN